VGAASFRAAFIPFDGGPLGKAIGPGFTFRDIDDEIMPEWAAHNGCDSVAVEEQVTENVRLVRYQACDEGATVELYVVEGGGHTWPDATVDFPEEFLGVTTHEISANDLMWNFFVAHPLAAPAEAAPTAVPPEPSATSAVVVAPSSGNGPGSGGNARLLTGFIAAVTAGAVAFASAAWYARRRWTR